MTPLDVSRPVLTVDDHEPMRRVLGNILRAIGFVDVDEAASGADALAMMRHKTYGLVISDWRLAQACGHRLLREMRADAALVATPFIVIGAEPDMQQLAAARQAGADASLVKPFSASLLRDTIRIAGEAKGAA